MKNREKSREIYFYENNSVNPLTFANFPLNKQVPFLLFASKVRFNQGS